MVSTNEAVKCLGAKLNGHISTETFTFFIVISSFSSISICTVYSTLQFTLVNFSYLQLTNKFMTCPLTQLGSKAEVKTSVLWKSGHLKHYFSVSL
jgi:hypothetical protein